MTRQRIFDFQENHKGLWINGPRDRTPDAALRRARGVHSVRERQLRSRDGSVSDAGIAATHSLFKFNGLRFQAAAATLYRDAIAISTVFDGTPLKFISSETRSGSVRLYLFVAGGGILKKVDRSEATATVTYTATSISFNDANPDTIVDANNQFVSEGFAIGQHLKVSGAGDNTGSYVIATVTSSTITLESIFELTAASAGSSITLVGVSNVTQWGITAPSASELTATAATVVPPQQTPIDAFDEISGIMKREQHLSNLVMVLILNKPQAQLELLGNVVFFFRH